MIVALGVVVILCGSVLQASVGVGLGIVAAPILSLLAVGWVPGPMLACAFLLSILIVVRDGRELDLRGASLALVGRVPGIGLGVLLLSSLAGSPWLEVSLGLLLTGAVAMSALKGNLTVQPRAAWVVSAGLLSGISGTAAGVGGPPVALVWSSLPPRRLRSTLAAYFVVGTGLSIASLLIAGRFGDTASLAWMLPTTVAGFLLSSRLQGWVDARDVRPYVLTLSGVSSIVLLVRGLFSLA